MEGPVFRTRTGEATVEAHRVMLLSKALRPPPEKWHGLRDVEQRFRQREADLLSNEEVRERFLLRSRVVDAVRRFLGGRGFVEVETPMLVPVPAGAMAQPFVTRHIALDRTLYLRIAIELYLKRCIVGGIERVFEIGRVFRNEGLDADHNPEYTLLESYEAYADYTDVMRMVEEMVSTVAQDVLGTTTITWKGQTIELRPPWPRIDLRSVLLEHGGVDHRGASGRGGPGPPHARDGCPGHPGGELGPPRGQAPVRQGGADTGPARLPRRLPRGNVPPGEDEAGRSPLRGALRGLHGRHERSPTPSPSSTTPWSSAAASRSRRSSAAGTATRTSTVWTRTFSRRWSTACRRRAASALASTAW